MRVNLLRNRRGIALILVMWVLVLLTVIVSGFIKMVRVESEGVLNFRQERRKDPSIPAFEFTEASKRRVR